MSRSTCSVLMGRLAIVRILPPRWRLKTRSDFPMKRAVGRLVDTLVETPVRLLVHLQRDFPQGPALVAADRDQMLDGQAGLGDHLQHFGQASRLVDGLDDQDLGYFHKGADDTSAARARPRPRASVHTPIIASMKRLIAIVEDEPAIRDNYAAAFTREGYVVRTYGNRAQAMAAFAARLPDLAVIDISLEDEPEGGFELCRQLRALSAELPIIFLTARDSELDAVSGLRLGRGRFPDQGSQPGAPHRTRECALPPRRGAAQAAR